MISCPLGFRVLGATTGRRRLVDAGAALRGYASCAPQAETHREAYLSAFSFPEPFRRHLSATGSTAGYSGPCWSQFLWFDIDRQDDLERALRDGRRLAGCILDRYRNLDDRDLLAFFSGKKGIHLGLPTFWHPEPAVLFHRSARRLAEHLAALAGICIDVGVYDAVRCFRAPNSRHPGTGLHKRRLTLDELENLSVGRVQQLADHPEPFDIPEPSAEKGDAAADWRAAEQWVRDQVEAKSQRRATANGNAGLTRQTRDFIRDGAEHGDRHRLLFSAAANLGEFGCSFELAYALLSESALDTGLPPKDVARQIQCGLAHGQKNVGIEPPTGVPQCQK